MKPGQTRKVHALVNPRSGTRFSWRSLVSALSPHWDVSGVDLCYQVSQSVEDGRAKARRAIEAGADTILVVGGDGIVNSIGAEMIDSDCALGVIPSGSGNGFARHFMVPTDWAEASAALVQGKRKKIDVGLVNGRPFFVTCGMAWDAALVKAYERSPVRGMVPYFISGASGILEYVHQPFDVVFDDGEQVTFEDPTLFTVANLSQFGGGAVIAPDAKADDGWLNLVYILRRDAANALARLPRLFDGTVTRAGEVKTRRLKGMTVRRAEAAPIQIDGELLDPTREIRIEIKRSALTVLVPSA